ncbi:phosphotransferase [Leeia sp. TBRC 13508]|uniref:Hydroxylysine kinase n=1 Tax=Leeia speluncae TaxID=2884804 RepID=A0ABS8D910_9NEIS|nr:phosphotransferase [Leeia speluncae]MCB6184709.1 phosphotransferase [Leeia speluncae]
MSESVGNLFSTVAAKTPEADVLACLDTIYGFTGELSLLNSERDENWLLKTNFGDAYVVKITHPAEDPGVTDFQTQALVHAIEKNPNLPIPMVIPRKDGQPYGWEILGDNPPRILRVYSYLDGIPLPKLAKTAAQRRDLGMTLARLNVALSDYEHPSAGHYLLWDIQHTDKLQSLLAEMPAGEQKTLAEKWMNHFINYTQPRLKQLRTQVIHNDLNPYNVLVSPEDETTTTGIIDFGDMVFAPLVDELGVACSYQLSSNENPLDTAAELIAGYHRINPLQPEEIDLLLDVIAARLLMTVTITGWRAARYPENATYILRNNKISWDGLKALDKLNRQEATHYLRQICEKEFAK